MRMQGKVIKWQDDKGFGMIEPVDGTPALFFHENFLLNATRRPRVGDSVFFVIAMNSEGKRRAERISLRNKPRQNKDNLFDIVYIAIASLFFLCIVAFVSQQRLSPVVALVYLFVSLLTFFLYWHDKNKAKTDQWRTPEKTLHLFSLVGGWPGALIAQRVLHHKSRKRPFQMIFATTILLNLIFVALFTIYQNDFNASAIVSKSYTMLRNQFHSVFNQQAKQENRQSLMQIQRADPSSPADPQAKNKKNGPVYSWTNTNGKRIYSTVGFPVNEPYTDGKIEW